MTKTPTTNSLPGMPDTDAILFESEKARGIHTADRFLQSPKAATVMQLLQRGGLSEKQIAEITSTSRNTIAAVRRYLIASGIISVEQVKRDNAAGFAAIGAASTERVLEIFANPAERAKVSAKDAAIIAAISSENYLVNAGQATARVEVVGVVGEAQLAEFARAIDAEATKTHFVADARGQKGDAVDQSGQTDDGDEFGGDELAELETMTETTATAEPESAPY